MNNFTEVLHKYKDNNYFKNIKIDKYNNNNNEIKIQIDNSNIQLKSYIHELPRKTEIKNFEYLNKGSHSTVYTTSNSNIIFKKIKKHSNEIKALIFHYLLTKYYDKKIITKIIKK